MADTLSSQQFSTHVSRRRVVAGTAALALAGATSPAFTQSTERSPNMPDNIRFSNPDTMQKPPGYSHVVEVTGPGRTVDRPGGCRAAEQHDELATLVCAGDKRRARAPRCRAPWRS